MITDSRKDDEQLLRIIRLRMTHQASDIAQAYGLKSERVRTICNRVLNDDLRASVKDGIETPDQVLAGYWRMG